VLLRLAYLGITNAFALLRLLPGSDRDKDAEILALRHQLAVLQRQLDGQRVRFEPMLAEKGHPPCSGWVRLAHGGFDAAPRGIGGGDYAMMPVRVPETGLPWYYEHGRSAAAAAPQ
jgi:hypothetical protein